MKRITLRRQRRLLYRLTRSLPALLALAGSVALSPVRADDVDFRGTLIEQPPCVINDGELITVDFGDEVMTTRIDGKQYTENVDFSLDCSAAVGNAPLKLRVAGTKAGFAEALDAQIPGLGIALTLDGQALKPNEWQTFSSTVRPRITAVPVKDEAVTLDGGSFRVLASLEMEYQ
jgi:type 1 fimbria pilin